ncbi:hypothetical protein E2C01_036358 [Portunus trituberculatus]|uniref:Uncharacterized protein n=1 Tax=Portunus trituberculatus TaxID=210409 RepID=A0A5B7FBU6_PORTR|nr:hypothetical protein [Portunus trituberculatus]
MEVDDPLLLPSLASLPSSSSITITKASVAQQRSSQSPSSSSTPCSTTAHIPSSHPSVSRTLPSTSSCDSISSANRAVLGPDMMPTIPLVPVQVPCGRGSIVSLPKVRGRPKGMPLSPSRGGNIHIRRGMKIRRIGLRGRGGRRLNHSMSLEERGGLIGEDSPLPLDDDAYVQDDMLMAPTYQDRWDQPHGLDSLVRNKAPSKQVHSPTTPDCLPTVQKEVKTPLVILIVIWETETNSHSDVHKPPHVAYSPRAMRWCVSPLVASIRLCLLAKSRDFSRCTRRKVNQPPVL